MIRQYELVEKVKSYDPDAGGGPPQSGLCLRHEGTRGAETRLGRPLFSPSVEVAYKLTNYKLDTASIVTALLHDTVEDTEVTLEDIENSFGKEISNLVDEVKAKLRPAPEEGKSENLSQAENFRKLLIAMSEDLRVLLVKLADRMHNMETLHFIKNPEKRQRIARETVEIYAHGWACQHACNLKIRIAGSGVCRTLSGSARIHRQTPGTFLRHERRRAAGEQNAGRHPPEAR